MSLPTQAGSRLLPFNRDEPGSWQRWENFWVDFLNAEPLLPWPGEPTVFKRVKVAEKYGVAGGAQDGIDIRAYMDDGMILAVQCKDYARLDLGKCKTAMNKAEKEFAGTQVFLLVLTEKEVSAELQKEADRRGNWQVIGRDTFSSWFLAGKFLPPSEQKRLVRRHFGELWIRELFPLPSDDFLISTERFFKQKNLICHDAQLQGEATRALAESLATDMCGSGPRVAILTATGGQGKTRLLKTVAEFVEERSPQRNVRFQNDSADSASEDYGMRAEDFLNISIFIDDAHRLENLRSRLLRHISSNESATLLIAARPNSLESLKRKLLETGFTESDWKEYPLPKLGFEDRRAIATELLGGGNAELASWLAEQSKDCPLICTVGADLFHKGGLRRDLIGSADFKRRVLDHLMDSSLESLFPSDGAKKERAEQALRILSMLNPIEGNDGLFKQIARLAGCNSWDIDRLIPQLESAGLLRSSRSKIRVVPDLLADHLVYDTAYGEGRMPSLVRELISLPIQDAFANLFGNLAEAEWRAKQEGNAEAYLDGMWENLKELLRDPDNQRIFGLLNDWRKIAIFQPVRTLELARILLDHEAARVAAGIAEVRHKGFRYDSISLHLGKLPDLLAPVAMHHGAHRLAAFDLLWEIGCVKDGPIKAQHDLPAAWQTISRTAFLANWKKRGPQDAFEWLKPWARQPDGGELLESGRTFLSKVASQWFEHRLNRRWSEVQAIQAYPAEIAEFRNEVLSWIETEIVPTGIGPIWASLPVILAAGFLCAEAKAADDCESASLAATAQRILWRILALHDDPFLRLAIWQYLSKRVADEERDEWKSEWMDLRESVTIDLPFQLARLASSYDIQEWNHERMQKWETDQDYDTSLEWWVNLASTTIREIRQRHPLIRETMELIDQVNNSLGRCRQLARWDIIAEAWSKQFPEERRGVLDELMANPEHALVSCLGFFLGLRGETDCEIAEEHTISALAHDDDRVRRAALQRLSWRDVKERERIAKYLNGMAGSDDPEVAAAAASFVSWNRSQATPYLDGVLLALNVGVLSTSDLVGVAETITHLTKQAKHRFSPELLQSFFHRLEKEEDINEVLPDHVLSVFHAEFPVDMFRVHLNRIRAKKYLPFFLDDWFLSGLPEHLGNPAFEKIAKELFDETIHADEDLFRQLSQLFDLSVARVSPMLAAELLASELRKQSRESQTLVRIVDLTGAGHGSVVYDAPDLTRELLKEINLLPIAEAKGLRDQLVFGAVPHSWSSTGEGIDEEYLWAKDRAGQLAEHYRSDPLLRDFYLAIVKNQEDLVAHERRRCLEEA